MPTSINSSNTSPEVEYWRGIHLKNSVLWMDAPQKVNLSFMSHAHRCTGNNHGKVLGTEPTAALCKSKGLNANFLLSPFERTFSLGEMDLELYPAGHMLGSAQLKVKTSGQGELVYTGHFDLEPHLTTEQAHVHQAQVLIMDSGWAHPQLVDDPVEKTQKSILNWIKSVLSKGQTPVLLVDPLGYAQEISALLLDAGLVPRVHRSISSNCKIYTSMGQDLSEIKGLASKVASNEVIIIPPHLAGSRILKSVDRACFALLAGSPRMAIHPMASVAEKTFFLSMAADYPMLVK